MNDQIKREGEDRRQIERRRVIERRLSSRRLEDSEDIPPPGVADYRAHLHHWHEFTSDACHHHQHGSCHDKCRFCPARCRCYCHRK